MSRHQTAYETELNQKELACREEIEKLEMQEASLEWELTLDIDDVRKNRTANTLRVVSKALSRQHRELAHIKELQITFLQTALNAYGLNQG
jgi:hypothetical protein